MKKSVLYKYDYMALEQGSCDPSGRFSYDVIGMEEPENLFTTIPIKPGLSLSFLSNLPHDYPPIKFEVENAPV